MELIVKIIDRQHSIVSSSYQIIIEMKPLAIRIVYHFNEDNPIFFILYNG